MAEPAATNAPDRTWWDIPTERMGYLALALLFLATVALLVPALFAAPNPAATAWQPSLSAACAARTRLP